MDINTIYENLCQIPSDINEHLPTLKKYASECNNVVELGTRDGVSTIGLLAGLPKELLSLDIVFPQSNYMKEMYSMAKKEGIYYWFKLGNSLEIELPETELLFIDTIHTYNQLSQELKRHGGKVKKFIILHDTTSCKEELQPAINEFLEQNKQWSIHEVFENNNGLLILKHE